MKKLGILLSVLIVISCGGCRSGFLQKPENISSAAVQSRRPVRLNNKGKTVRILKKQAKQQSAAQKKISKSTVTGVGFAKLQSEYGLVTLPTYDGSGQGTHPKILYFPKGWNGFKYWMSFTPYPNGKAEYENPSIVVSNDMTNWMAPPRLENPVSGVPSDVLSGGHYSDSHIVMRGNAMELWYRYDFGTPRTCKTNYSEDYYLRRISTDGIHWSAPAVMQKSTGGILSLAVNYENGSYQFWYTDYSHRLLHAQSKNGTDWTNTRTCDIPLPDDYDPWHQDIIRYGTEYYLMQTAINVKHYSFKLFLSHSSDGIHFSAGVPFYPDNDPVILSQAWLYRSTLFVENNVFRMMIPIRFPDGRWYMTKASLPISQFTNLSGSQKAIILPSPSEKKTVRTL